VSKFLKVLAIFTLIGVIILSALIGMEYYKAKVSKQLPQIYIKQITISAGTPYAFTRRGLYYKIYPPEIIDGVLYMRIDDMPIVFGGYGNVSYGVMLDNPRDIILSVAGKKLMFQEDSKNVVLSFGSTYLLHKVLCKNYVCMAPVREVAEILGRKVDMYQNGKVLVIHNE
jgi:hypothetical protein